MFKISIAGFLLFLAMVVTAITVSHNQPAYAREQHVWMSPGLQADSTQTFDATGYRKVLVSGGSDGMEGNPFIICIGLVAIMSLAMGFLGHHGILEARRKENEAEQAAQRKANQFGTRPGGKEPPR
jgi:hypothetical protein